MTQIDEFESIFRRAERERFSYQPMPMSRVALLTDRDRDFAESAVSAVQRHLPALAGSEFELVTGDRFSTVNEVIELLTDLEPDLVVTFRHLQEGMLVPQHSLGVYLDVLTQVLKPPVLMLPGTSADPDLPTTEAKSVLVLTDHIRGDARLISAAAAFAPAAAELHLAHVEDDLVFQRYMNTIDRIPGLNSDVARDQLEATLLGDARQYMEAAVEGLEAAGVPHTTTLHLERGHRLKAFKSLIEQSAADVCVFNTKDDEQLAMHGMAYAVAVEVVDRSLLLL